MYAAVVHKKPVNHHCQDFSTPPFLPALLMPKFIRPRAPSLFEPYYNTRRFLKKINLFNFIVIYAY
ncbi:hypothetical protein THIOM_005717 [Candidatus Thiomargarita nelsonii]|uniref:Uncharacterized protein n=1 Tax=Candidatus Thiomargarita nelsonii TaxID=1003181 RepID=A0A176RSG8_9GAMM|nr:hypothetical protein THIOM_005717 [Candidatus Thiomargarita nelsonii]